MIYGFHADKHQRLLGTLRWIIYIDTCSPIAGTPWVAIIPCNLAPIDGLPVITVARYNSSCISHCHADNLGAQRKRWGDFVLLFKMPLRFHLKFIWADKMNCSRKRSLINDLAVETRMWNFWCHHLRCQQFVLSWNMWIFKVATWCYRLWNHSVIITKIIAFGIIFDVDYNCAVIFKLQIVQPQP